jgi:hypothetical protein
MRKKFLLGLLISLPLVAVFPDKNEIRNRKNSNEQRNHRDEDRTNCLCFLPRVTIVLLVGTAAMTGVALEAVRGTGRFAYSVVRAAIEKGKPKTD